MGAAEDDGDSETRGGAQEELSEFGELMEEKFNDSELPYSCNVNFDNFDPDKATYLNEEEFRLLELYMIFPEGFLKKRYSAMDRVEYDNGITLVVIGCEDNEHELSTYLVTYSKEEWYVDNVRLAYDEIAEGFLRIESVIEDDKITRTTFISLDEVMEEKEHYFIQDDGQIVWEKDIQ